jgi:hypothetical protein
VTPGTPSLLDLGEGFLALPRRLCGSPFYRALGPDERSVVVEALLAARYAEGGEFWFAGQRIPLAVGQFIESEEEIARRAGVTRKICRTAYGKMIAAGLMERSRVHPAGQCPHVTTILGYERIRFGASEAGPRTGQPTGREGATNGPADGPTNGPHQNKGNKGTKEPGNVLSLVAEAGASDDAGPFARVVEVWDRVCVPAGFAKARSTPQQRKAAAARMREAGWFEAFGAACRHVAADPFYRGGGSSGWILTLGWLLKPGNTEKTAERAATRRAPAAVPAQVTAPAAPHSAFVGGRREL